MIDGWMIYVAIWIAAQIPFMRYLVTRREMTKAYPQQASWILVPFSNRWQVGVAPAHMDEMRHHRLRMLVYYYAVFLAPFLVFFALLAIGVL